MEELDPLVRTFCANAAKAGFEVFIDDVPSIAGAEVSEAAWGIAETGSVVIAASPGEPRARSLLPDVHISLLAADRIVASLQGLFAVVGDRLPSALAIVSGPSRSTDIEQRLTVGVHGPGGVCVVVRL